MIFQSILGFFQLNYYIQEERESGKSGMLLISIIKFNNLIIFEYN